MSSSPSIRVEGRLQRGSKLSLLAVLLSLTLALPCPAGASPELSRRALRTRNGGLEERTPTTDAIAKALHPTSSASSAAGLEEWKELSGHMARLDSDNATPAQKLQATSAIWDAGLIKGKMSPQQTEQMLSDLILLFRARRELDLGVRSDILKILGYAGIDNLNVLLLFRDRIREEIENDPVLSKGLFGLEYRIIGGLTSSKKTPLIQFLPSMLSLLSRPPDSEELNRFLDLLIMMLRPGKVSLRKQPKLLLDKRVYKEFLQGGPWLDGLWNLYDPNKGNLAESVASGKAGHILWMMSQTVEPEDAKKFMKKEKAARGLMTDSDFLEALNSSDSPFRRGPLEHSISKKTIQELIDRIATHGYLPIGLFERLFLDQHKQVVFVNGDSGRLEAFREEKGIVADLNLLVERMAGDKKEGKIPIVLALPLPKGMEGEFQDFLETGKISEKLLGAFSSTFRSSSLEKARELIHTGGWRALRSLDQRIRLRFFGPEREIAGEFQFDSMVSNLQQIVQENPRVPTVVYHSLLKTGWIFSKRDLTSSDGLAVHRSVAVALGERIGQGKIGSLIEETEGSLYSSSLPAGGGLHNLTDLGDAIPTSFGVWIQDFPEFWRLRFDRDFQEHYDTQTWDGLFFRKEDDRQDPKFFQRPELPQPRKLSPKKSPGPLVSVAGLEEGTDWWVRALARSRGRTPSSGQPSYTTVVDHLVGLGHHAVGPLILALAVPKRAGDDSSRLYDIDTFPSWAWDDLHRGAAEVLGRIGPDKAADAIPALVKVLTFLEKADPAQDPREGWKFIRVEVVKALGEMGPLAAKRATPPLAKRVRARGYDQTDAIQALEKMGPAASPAAGALLEVLRKEEIFPAPSYAAAAIKAATRRATQYNAAIRTAAAKALGAIGPGIRSRARKKQVVAQLQVTRLSSPEELVRKAAESALKEISPAANRGGRSGPEEGETVNQALQTVRRLIEEDSTLTELCLFLGGPYSNISFAPRTEGLPRASLHDEQSLEWKRLEDAISHAASFSDHDASGGDEDSDSYFDSYSVSFQSSARVRVRKKGTRIIIEPARNRKEGWKYKLKWIDEISFNILMSPGRTPGGRQLSALLLEKIEQHEKAIKEADLLKYLPEVRQNWADFIYILTEQKIDPAQLKEWLKDKEKDSKWDEAVGFQLSVLTIVTGRFREVSLPKSLLSFHLLPEEFLHDLPDSVRDFVRDDAIPGLVHRLVESIGYAGGTLTREPGPGTEGIGPSAAGLEEGTVGSGASARFLDAIQRIADEGGVAAFDGSDLTFPTVDGGRGVVPDSMVRRTIGLGPDEKIVPIPPTWKVNLTGRLLVDLVGLRPAAIPEGVEYVPLFRQDPAKAREWIRTTLQANPAVFILPDTADVSEWVPAAGIRNRTVAVVQISYARAEEMADPRTLGWIIRIAELEQDRIFRVNEVTTVGLEESGRYSVTVARGA